MDLRKKLVSEYKNTVFIHFIKLQKQIPLPMLKRSTISCGIRLFDTSCSNLIWSKWITKKKKIALLTQNLTHNSLWVDYISVFFKWWLRFSFCLSIHNSLLAFFSVYKHANWGAYFVRQTLISSSLLPFPPIKKQPHPQITSIYWNWKSSGYFGSRRLQSLNEILHWQAFKLICRSGPLL